MDLVKLCTSVCGSGSISFWASRIRIRIRHSHERIRIQILSSSGKKIGWKTLISIVLRLLYDFFTLIEWCKCNSVPDPLGRGTDPRIRIKIRTNMSRIRNTALHIVMHNHTVGVSVSKHFHIFEIILLIKNSKPKNSLISSEIWCTNCKL